MKQIIILLITFNFINAQSDVPLTLRTQFNGNYSYTIIGNTHNEFDNWQNPPPPCQMLTQSSANLNILPTQTIVAAYLYWSGIGDGTFNPIVNLNGSHYLSNSISIAFPENNNSINYFGSFVDVTSQIQNTGNGQYIFSNIDLNPNLANYCSSAVYYLGWSIVVVYQEIGLQNIQLNIYDGLNAVNTFFNNGITNITIDNLNIIDVTDAKISYVAYNGSTNLFFDEFILWNGNTLSNALNPPNNPFNSTNNYTSTSALWNMDIDSFDISPYINIGDTTADITIGSGHQRFLQTLVTSIRSELPDATVQINQVTGQNVCNNRDLVVNYTVQNTNSNAVLPANVPVSFYANNIFLQTVNTPSSIAIGGSLALQTTLTIPAGIPNTFTLLAAVDTTMTIGSTVAESNESNNEATQIITLAGNSVTPTFSIPSTFCQNGVVPSLPLTSLNNISGTWLPNVINNQASGTYVFTSNSGQCVLNFSLNVVITPNSTPTFSIPTTFCQNAVVPSLPLTSLNAISGTWSPTVISNQASGSYVFTPTASQCAVPFSLNVVITPTITPAFSIPLTFCQNAVVPSLPLTSVNNISGTWLPNVINNQTSGTYVFTPTAGQCAAPFSLNVMITQTITPTFSIVSNYCQDETVPVLPLLSLNTILGSWSPSSISNQASGAYVFTPNAGQCAAAFSLNVIINYIVPTFSIPTTFCQNAVVPSLPSTSLNTVSGSWSPNVISNQSSGTYIFTPAAGQCAAIFSLNVVIIPNSTPAFSIQNTFCQGSSVPVLPVTSSNGILGSWSPSVISNQSSGTYVFTPTAGQCALPFSFNVIITPKVVPTFTQVAPICSGATLANLPLTSLNGIVGSWSPTVNNTATTTYIFTPNTSECAQQVSMTIVVNPLVVSNFQDVTICENNTSFSLPNTAPNGIVGSWLPATIDFTTSGAYTFTPTNLQCASSQTIAVTITKGTLTDFDYTISAPFTSNATITITAIAPSGTYLYQLDTTLPQTEPIFQNVTSGFHSITVTEENGCSNPITKTGILVLYYPTFFTPNGDGFNDTWNIRDLFLQPTAKILIFDRYGKLLQQISPSSFGWDGTYNGNLMPPDTYWFSLDYRYDEMQREFRSFFALKR
jgi:gliding motility-associated-like protein